MSAHVLDPSGFQNRNHNLLGFIFVLFALVIALSAAGCASGDGGQVTTPVQTQGAQTVGRDQGSAQASESGSAQVHMRPMVNNIFGAKSVKIVADTDGGSSVEVEGSDSSEVAVTGSSFGNFNMNEGTQEASVSSGGGAAGGTGGAARETQGTGNRAGGNVAAPPVEAPNFGTGGGQ